MINSLQLSVIQETEVLKPLTRSDSGAQQAGHTAGDGHLCGAFRWPDAVVFFKVVLHTMNRFILRHFIISGVNIPSSLSTTSFTLILFVSHQPSRFSYVWKQKPCPLVSVETTCSIDQEICLSTNTLNLYILNLFFLVDIHKHQTHKDSVTLLKLFKCWRFKCSFLCSKMRQRFILYLYSLYVLFVFELK